MTPPRSPSSWLSAAGGRLLHGWPVKFAGTAAGMAVFFALYFWLLAHPLRPVTVLPVTWIDRALGIQPWTLPLYLSLWVYVTLAAALVVGRRELWAVGLAWTVLSAV